MNMHMLAEIFIGLCLGVVVVCILIVCWAFVDAMRRVSPHPEEDKR